MRAVMGCCVLSCVPRAALAPSPASPHRGPALARPCLSLSPAGVPHLQHGFARLPWQPVRHRVMDRRGRIVPHASRHRSRASVVACDQTRQQGLDVTCVEAMRTAFAAVCTSLSPRQGGVRRPPPRRARGCNLPRLRPRLFGCLLPQGGRRKCATGGDRVCDCSPTRRAMHAEPAHEIGPGRRLGTADGVSNVDRDGNHAVYRTAVQVFPSAFDTRPTRRSSSRPRTRWSI